MERNQPGTPHSEWSPLQNETGAGSGQPETAKGEKDKNKKKRAAEAASGGHQSGEQRPASGQSETARPPVTAEGLIWLRAASDHVRNRQEQASKTPVEQPQETVSTEASDAAKTAPDQAPDQISEQHMDSPDSHQEAEQAGTVNNEYATEQQESQADDQSAGAHQEMPVSHETDDPYAQTQEASAYSEDAQEYAQPYYRAQAEANAGSEEQVAVVAAEQGNPFERSYAPPPMPPDPSKYRRSFWSEAPAAEGYGSLPPVYDYEQIMAAQQPVTVQETVSWTQTETTKPYTSETPPGLQRTPADVARAAWTGLLAGWYFARRGKRRATEQAHKTGYEAGHKAAMTKDQPLPEAYTNPVTVPLPPERATSQRLEAEPLHAYPQSEVSRVTVLPTAVETPTAGAKPSKTEAPAAVLNVSMERAAQAAGAERTVQSMGRRELLQVAKTIRVEGIRLKDVFAAKRIDEAGLRAVVETYLRGGDVRQQLTQEVVNKEKSFEIDPLSRGRRDADIQGGGLARVADKAREQGGKLVASSKVTAQKAGKALTSAQHEIIENTDSSIWLAITALVIIYSLIAMLLWG